ncbi:hypothetical protein SDC9_203239 [bioreactor metagenome]|uniref:Uncharacterized protein n=1 Tax=bioreactor metagenome TaxID=1076179 RepID=A0A645IVW1_9ZZZZ
MEAQTSLEGADGHAVLDAEAAVHLHLALVVGPAHAELDDALGLDQALQQGVLGVFGVLLDEGPQAFHHFGDGLQEFGLTGVALCHFFQELAYGLVLLRELSDRDRGMR